MLRRNARLRREYLYTKGVEAAERSTHDRKRKVKAAFEAGAPVPSELRGEADRLMAEAALDGVPDDGEAAASGVDSEYANAGVADPRVLITTSHDPPAADAVPEGGEADRAERAADEPRRPHRQDDRRHAPRRGLQRTSSCSRSTAPSPTG